MKNLYVVLFLCAAMACMRPSFAGQLSEPQRFELLERVRGGDRAAMLKAGETGDARFVPSLEGYIQTNMSALSNDLVRLEQYARERGRTSGLSIERELKSRRSDARIQGAQMALAKLGEAKYLDEIIEELTVTNARAGAESSLAEAHRAKVRALEKLKYIGNPSTIKSIGPCLYDTADPYPYLPGARDKVVAPPTAAYAISALRSMVTNAPPTNEFKTWQQWWEQNKDKYP